MERVVLLERIVRLGRPKIKGPIISIPNSSVRKRCIDTKPSAPLFLFQPYSHVYFIPHFLVDNPTNSPPEIDSWVYSCLNAILSLLLYLTRGARPPEIVDGGTPSAVPNLWRKKKKVWRDSSISLVSRIINAEIITFPPPTLPLCVLRHPQAPSFLPYPDPLYHVGRNPLLPRICLHKQYQSSNPSSTFKLPDPVPFHGQLLTSNEISSHGIPARFHLRDGCE